jgi:hypothetical protein
MNSPVHAQSVSCHNDHLITVSQGHSFLFV